MNTKYQRDMAKEREEVALTRREYAPEREAEMREVLELGIREGVRAAGIAPPHLPNPHAAPCCRCGDNVVRGDGLMVVVSGTWRTRHRGFPNCMKEGKGVHWRSQRTVSEQP